MNKGENRNKRKKFVQKAFNDPKLAADELRSMADGLEECKNTSDLIFALTEILFVSDSTIFRDIS